MKKLLLITIILLVTLNIFAEKYHTYDMEFVITLPTGGGKGKLTIEPYSPYKSGPSAFAFDKKNNLYVSDILAGKLVKFDESYTFVAEYKDCYAAKAKHLFIDDKENFITYNKLAIKMDTPDLKKKFVVSPFESSYKNMYTEYNFTYHNGKVYIPLNDGSMISIDNPGTDYKENINKAKKVSPGTTKTRSGNEVIIDEQNRIIENGDIVTVSYDQYVKFKKEKQKKNPTRSTKKLDISITIEEYLNQDLLYLGKDNDKNTYWFCTDLVMVIDKQGELLEAFVPNPVKSRIFPTIHPSGDVYYLTHDQKEVYLWKISRKW